MAVVDRAWHAYQGETTSERWRFLVLPRFAWGDIFRSRLLTVYYVLCCLVPIAYALAIYARYNVGFLSLIGISAKNLDQALPIGARFFRTFDGVEAAMGFVFASFIGPALIAPDVAHNAMPLFLGRPFSRWEYVLGKFASLAVLLSAITWVPALLLFGLQSFLAEDGWASSHLDLLGAAVATGLIWVIVVSLLVLAISAWIRWRPVATALLFAISVVGAGIGGIVYAMFHEPWGFLLSPGVLLQVIAIHLFGTMDPNSPLPPLWAACVGVVFYTLLSVLLLARRVRATEVVR
jgi:ABC-2 type transport system permease protein